MWGLKTLEVIVIAKIFEMRKFQIPNFKLSVHRTGRQLSSDNRNKKEEVIPP
jgi:hypothetical protein